ncbi:MAG: TonB-dependent receptor [Woeseiaceae bacterium]|nr:TonB-dependent receptor [Woeseiaceae bacterium]
MSTQTKFIVSPITAAVAAALSPGQAAQAQEEEARASGGVLEEIVVTARKRTESIQDAPIAIQALSQDTLAAMGAKAMEDYARFIPSVSVVTYNNSSNVVVFRGAITSPGYIAASTSSVYLDEISVTITGSQPGIRMVDIARVEALSGPQGTLYGSDAQAGTLRIVTNKPDSTGFEAVFDGELRTGSESDPSYRGSLVFNVPLAEDKLALRLVGYSDRDGGYIDNVFGRTPDSSFFDGDVYPGDFGTLDNSASVEKRWNETDIYGGRASLLWNINDKWSATLGITHQTTEAGADNHYDPFVGDLQTVRFHDEYTDDKYDLYSLTLEGDLGFAQLVSATSYFDRKLNYLQDVTTYARYWTARYCVESAYTQEDYPYYVADPESGNIIWWPVYCHGPTANSDVLLAQFLRAQADKFTQEIRLASDGETIDWIVGLFYERSNDDWQSSFAQPTTGGDGSVNLYQQSLALQQYEMWRGVEYPEAKASWYSDNKTDWEQKAIFGEVTWHLTDRLDATFGGRLYDRSNTNYYFVNRPGSFTMPAFTPPEPREGTDEEFIPKVSINYNFDAGRDARMMYGLYTRGKRPGGINRQRGEPFFPATYVSDLMDNYEFGYKSTFGGGSGRFNVTAYHMEWSDYQHELTDPSSIDCEIIGLPPGPTPGVCDQPWQRVVANLGKAHITGVNVELDYAPSASWVLGLNAEFMEAETDSAHDLTADGEPDILAGLRLPLVPEFKAAAWAEYHWPVQLFGNNNAFVRTQWSYNGDSVSIIEPISPDDANNPQFTNAAYTIGDLRFGLQGDDWEASIFINNITDERAELTHGDGQFEWAQSQSAEGRDHHLRLYTNRPREVGVRYMKRWGD